MGTTESRPVPQMTVNSIDADVPLVPPIVFFLLIAVAFGIRRKIEDPGCPFLPEIMQKQRALRWTIFVLGIIGSALAMADAASALHAAGSGVTFTPVAGLATTGAFAATRNPIYCLLLGTLPLLAVLFDSAWILVMTAPMFLCAPSRLVFSRTRCLARASAL
jgi:protein-S-isoprenylcysteine O-methyltransferase Ste14